MRTDVRFYACVQAMVSSLKTMVPKIGNFVKICSLIVLTSAVGMAHAAENNKIVVEKDPATGEVTMRSIPTGSDQPEKQSPAKVELAPVARETHVSKNPVQDAFSGFWVISGLLLLLIGGVWMLICMAQESVFWLIAGLLLNPIAIFVFLFVHRRQAAGPFLISLCGYFLLYLAYIERTHP